jgi:signal transduction histidine kinase
MEEDQYSVQELLAVLGLGTLIHDIHGQIGQIRVTSLLLEGSEDDQTRDGSLDKIMRASERLTGLLEDLSQLAKLGIVKSTVPPQPTDLVSVANDVLTDLGENSFILKAYIPANDIIRVHADPSLLRGILSNLLSNAIRASDKVEGDRIPSLTLRLSESGSAVVSVEDFGPGVDEAVFRDLFQRPIGGWRAEGAGVGLFLGGRLVREWGGKLRLKEPGPGGTVFELELLRVAPERQRMAMADESEKVLEAKNKSALIVEDHRDMLQTLGMIVGDFGFDVDLASNIEEARQFLSERAYDVLIVDIILGPGPDGLRVAEFVRESGTDTAVIAITGYPTTMDIRKAFGVQVDDLLVKSELNVDRLRTIIQRALENRAERSTQSPKYNEGQRTLTVMAHELRAPIVAAMRQAESIELGTRGPLNGPQRSGLAVLRGELRRSLDLVTAHLDLDMIERQVARFRPRPVDLAKVLSDLVERHRVQAEYEGIRLRSSPVEATIVKLDPDKLIVAINPLIDNALKYTPSGGVVRLNAKVSGHYVIIEIADSGPGMKPSDATGMLIGDADLDRVPSARARGAGLGLTIARRYAQLHGGRLEIVGQRSPGALVRLWLRQNEVEE